MLKPTTTEDRAREQAQCQMEEISRMIARLDLDWDRLEELRHDRAILDSDNLAELTDLEAIADDCEDQDEAERRIDEDPLSCEVRSGWTSPGEEMTADERRTFDTYPLTGRQLIASIPRLVRELSVSLNKKYNLVICFPSQVDFPAYTLSYKVEFILLVFEFSFEALCKVNFPFDVKLHSYLTETVYDLGHFVLL